jgi:predicted RNA methylase
LLPGGLYQKGFVDYGSGKGRVLFCAEYLGFNRLTGIELDPELSNFVQENLKSYTKKRSESRFYLRVQNALDYEIQAEDCVFFFFNPFSEKVMEVVAAHIREHAVKTHQKVIVLYMNPQFERVWLNRGFKIDQTLMTKRYKEALVLSFGNSIQP